MILKKEASNQLRKIEVLILDFDGVVFSTKDSFRKTIQETVDFYFFQLLKLKGSRLKLVTQKEIQKFKDTGMYNDDWKLTRFLILYFLSVLALKNNEFLKLINKERNLRNILELTESLGKLFNSQKVDSTYLRLIKKDETIGFQSLMSLLKNLNEIEALQKIFPNLADSLPKLKSFIQTKVNKEDLPQKIFEEFYLGKNLYEEFYNQSPLFNLSKGFIENEKPLITIETLEKLNEKFGKLIVYSERPRKQAIYVLKKFNLKDYFNLEKSYFREEINKFDFLGDPGKPNPTPLFNLLKKLKAENKLSAYVGDTAADAILIEKLKTNYLVNALSIIISKHASSINADVILKNINELRLIF
ncbi:MAG: HAD hydrolase-like protein [Candidatus Bathyarchaeia archaeon]